MTFLSMDKRNSIFKEMDPIYLSTDTIPEKESTAFSTPLLFQVEKKKTQKKSWKAPVSQTW